MNLILSCEDNANRPEDKIKRAVFRSGGLLFYAFSLYDSGKTSGNRMLQYLFTP